MQAGPTYMVRLDERLDQVKRLYVDRGKYFAINRGRQYGKTTTLKALERYFSVSRAWDWICWWKSGDNEMKKF